MTMTLDVTAEQMAAYDARVAAEEAGTEAPEREPAVSDALAAAAEAVEAALEALKYAVLHSGVEVEDFDFDDPDVPMAHKAMMAAGTHLMGAFEALVAAGLASILAEIEDDDDAE